MSSVPFDPYHKWLGIPKRDQPAHHYRLLGIPLYEEDVQVVEAAADRQMAFLRKFQTGEHSADALKLLNEVSRARICLLKPEAKAAYDESLRATLQTPAPQTQTASTRVPSGISLPQWATTPVLAGAAAAVVLLIVGAVVFFSSGSSPKPAASEVAVAPEPQPAPEIPVSSPLEKAPVEKTPTPATKTPDSGAGKSVANLPPKPDGSAPKTNTALSKPVVAHPDPTKMATKTPTSTNDKSTAQGVRKPASGTVNLLARINVDQHRISGQWSAENQQLVSPAEGSSRLGVPYVVPDEYDLAVKIERLSGKRTFALVFPIQGHPAQLLIDTQGATETKLANGGSGKSSDLPVFEGQLLEVERPAEFVLQVRRGRIAVTADGKEILKWKGDASSFETSLNENLLNPRERELMLVSLGNSFRVSKLELSPPQKSASTATEEDAVNLLSLVNPQQDAPNGEWAFKDGGLVGTSPGPTQQILIEVPYEPATPEYDLTISATRQGLGAWTAGLQVQGRPCVFLMNTIASHQLYGISDVDGKPAAQNETTKLIPRVPNDAAVLIKCRVRQHAVTVEANGDTVIDWKGDISKLSMPADIKPSNPKTLSLLVQGGTVRFNSMTFTPVTDGSDTPKNMLADSDKSDRDSADSFLQVDKLPTPDAAAQDAARKAVRDSLKIEYALAKKADAKHLDAKTTLAKTLMSRAESADGNPAARYVMLSDAAELAAESGQLSLAWEILNELGDQFDLPSLPLMERAAKTAAKFAKTDEDIAYLASMYVLLLDEAVRLDDFETVAKAAPAAAKETRKNAMLKDQLAAHSKRISGLREAFELAKPAREVLKVNPDDETANLAWGRYLCFYKGDWLTGLPLLAKSADEKLVSLAKREVEQPRDLQPLIQLGDDWWAVAEQEKDPVRMTIRERAADAWQLALPLASGLQKKELETKVEQIFKPTKFFETTGEGQGVSVANPDLNPGPFFTVEFWVATQSKSGILISKREDRRDTGIALAMNRGRPTFIVGKSASGSETGKASRQAINDGRWHHIAIVKLGSRLGLFVDGKWTAQTEYSEYLSGSPWKVGHDGQAKYAEPAARFCRLRFSKEARYLLSFHPEKNYLRDKSTLFIP